MANFSHVTPGSPRGSSPAVSASWLNAVSDAANYHHNRVAGGSVNPASRSHPINGDLVKIKNLAGKDLLRGHVVQLGKYELTDLDFRRLWFEADLVADPIGSRIAIIRTAVKSGKRANAQMSGVSTAMVDVTDISHTHATPVVDNEVFKSGTSGPLEFISPIATSGVQEVAVLIGAGSVDASAKGALAIIKGTVPGSSAIDTSSATAGTGSEREGATVVTIGSLAASATDTTFSAGALLVGPDGKSIVEDDPDFVAPDPQTDPPTLADRVISVRNVINPSMTAFTGEGPGVFVGGVLVKQDGVEWFVLPTFEIRSQPGWSLGTDAEDDAQTIYHEGGKRTQQVDRDEC